MKELQDVHRGSQSQFQRAKIDLIKEVEEKMGRIEELQRVLSLENRDNKRLQDELYSMGA
jgi:chromosome segregation ATPase